MGRAARHEVTVWRGNAMESRHTVHVAVVDATDSARCGAGDLSFLTFARSAVKAVQALPLVVDGAADRFAMTEEELALCCASHSGEPEHVEVAAGMLRKIDATEDMLACGPHAPFDAAASEALRAAGREPTRLHNNCSGKHAGMLTLARHHDWPLAGYHEAGHPVQQRMLAEMSAWSGVDEDAIATGVDGCGVVTFGLPLVALARIHARLALAARQQEGPVTRLVRAVVAHPHLIAGTNRLCTALLRTTGGRVFAKVGAEGVYCASVPGAGLGVALKVEDGAQRAAEPAILSILESLGAIGADDMNELRRWARPQVLNTRHERVGRIETSIELVER